MSRMLKSPLHWILSGSLFITVLTLTEPSSGQGSDVPKMRHKEKDAPEKKEPWESLSPEQREKLRQALRDVWSDPAVISAREEVKQASEVYQAAIKTAVSRADPSVADVITRIQKENRGKLHENILGRRPKGAPRKGAAPKRGFDQLVKPPGFMESLTPEVRGKVRTAEAAAMVSDVVKSAKAELEELRKEDETLRHKRLAAHRKLRKATIDEMVRIDPSIEPMRKQLSGGDRNRHRPSPAQQKEKNSSERGKKPDSRPDPAPSDKKPE